MDLSLSLGTIIATVAARFNASSETIERSRDWSDALAENAMLLGLVDGLRCALTEDTVRYIEDSRAVTEASVRFSAIFDAIKRAR